MKRSKPDGESETKHLVRCGWYEPPEDNSIVRFCQDSGLHGLKYITGPRQHLCERFFWLVAFIMAAVAGGVLIFKTWDQYKNLPVVIVQSPKQLSVEEFPFPSVTVCGLNRVKKEAYEKYQKLAGLEDDGNDTIVEEAKEIVKILDALCEPSNIFSKSMLWKDKKMFGMGIQAAFLNLELSQSFQNESKIMKLLNESSQSCDDLIPVISFRTGYWQASMFFEKVETDFGICCTFNSMPLMKLKPWTEVPIDDLHWEAQIFNYDHPWLNETISADTLIFTEETKNRHSPHRQLVPGITPGLSFPLVTRMNESHCTSPDLYGFVVSISNSLDAPSTKDKENFIEFNTEVFFTPKAKLTLADDSTKRFTPERRGCYFANELTLRDYSVYTQSNCLQECIANLTMEYCQCYGLLLVQGSGKLWFESRE